ncbi:ABC transporter permease [Streptomyces erythrochromogenes]|uniref:ABC transporter permease n=1 Tax=Streptomyces erythrochromogenes TaxID=285574 RepID=UPI0036F74E2F
MTALKPAAPRTGPAPAAGRAVTALAWRQTRRGTLLTTAVAAGMSAVAVAAHHSTVQDPADAAALQALAGNPAIRTLFGEPLALHDPGGFAVWRTGTALAVILSVWALLTATRITRGEEDAGRWDVLLAGRVPVTTVVARHIAVLTSACLLAGAAVFTGLTAAGAAPGGAAVHSAGLALCGVFFAAAGAMTAQVYTTRSAASGAAVAVLGAGMLLKMVGDGVTSLGWLRWLSPFGLTALSRPYDGNQLWPLVILLAACLTVAAGAAAAAGRRDIRGGYWPAPSGRAPQMRLLGSIHAFAVRRLLRPLAAWSAGVGAYYLLIGVLAVSMTDFLTDNPRFADLAAQAGFAGLGTVKGYTATLFALLAVPAGAFVAVRLAALAEDESGRRLTLLFAQPLTRTKLLTGEIAAALGGVTVLTTMAGLATWTGTQTVGADLGLIAALSGAWNVLPIALLCLGTAVLALAWAPRAVAVIGSLPAAGGFLLKVIADTSGWPAWIGQLSPFAHLAAVPGVPVNWPAALPMTAIAALAATTGAIGYQRRDLHV